MPTKQQLIDVLTPHNDRIYAVISRAWARWNALPGTDRRACALPRTRANLIWAYMVEEAAVEFADVDGARYIEDPISCMYVIDNSLVIRFKKLDEDGYSRNYPTPRSVAFNGQYPIDGIPAFLPRVDVGYIENAFGTGFQRIMAAYREGDLVRWWYDIEPVSQVYTIPEIGEERRGRVKRRGVEQPSLLADTGTNDGGAEE